MSEAESGPPRARQLKEPPSKRQVRTCWERGASSLPLTVFFSCSFVPAFNSLTTAAMEHADVADFEGIPLRVVRADYLAVIALSTGRAKDFARILALLESPHVTRKQIQSLAAQNGLETAWARFEERFLS